MWETCEKHSPMALSPMIQDREESLIKDGEEIESLYLSREKSDGIPIGKRYSKELLDRSEVGDSIKKVKCHEMPFVCDEDYSYHSSQENL